MLAQNTEKMIKGQSRSLKLPPEQQRCCFVLDITYFPAQIREYYSTLCFGLFTPWLLHVYHSPLDSEGAAVVWDTVDVSPLDVSETFCPAHMVFRV